MTKNRFVAICFPLFLIANAQTVGCAVPEDDAQQTTADEELRAGSSTIRTWSGECLDITGSGTANGTRVIAYDCNGGANQRWYTTSKGELINPATGKCLDLNAASGSVVVGAVLEIWDCNGGSNQRFGQMHDNTLTSGGLCVTVQGRQNGAGLAANRCIGSDRQRYHFQAGACKLTATPTLDAQTYAMSRADAAPEVSFAPPTFSTCCGGGGATFVIPAAFRAWATRFEKYSPQQIAQFEQSPRASATVWTDPVPLALYKTLRQYPDQIPWDYLKTQFPRTMSMLSWLATVPVGDSPYTLLAQDWLAKEPKARATSSSGFYAYLPGDVATSVAAALTMPAAGEGCRCTEGPLATIRPADMKEALLARGFYAGMGDEWWRVLDVLAKDSGACAADLQAWLESRGDLDAKAIDLLVFRLNRVKANCPAAAPGYSTCAPPTR